MERPLNYALYTNQFFGGVGGEDAAGRAPTWSPEPVGPARLVAAVLPPGSFRGTCVCGDNHAVEHAQATIEVVCQGLYERGVDVLLAGPAFDAGRFGVACAQIASAVQKRLGVTAVTAMFADNPGVALASPSLVVLGTGRAVGGLDETLRRMVDVGGRLARLTPLASAESDGYLPRGGRRNALVDRPGAVRAVDLLLDKLQGRPYASEVPLPRREAFRPAAGIEDLARARVALVTTSGLVPRGNPDAIESRRASRWAAYPLDGVASFEPDRYTCVHGGFDNHHVHHDPHRAVPLDAFRRLEREGRIGGLASRFYTTVGAGAPVARAERFGQEIAEDLKREGVSAVVLTAT